MTSLVVLSLLIYHIIRMDVKVQKLRGSKGYDLAYRYKDGTAALPTLVFLSGFHSDMGGTKATFLAQSCASRNQSCLLFDYSGHGQSGGNLQDGTIGQWLEDSITIIEQVTTGPLLLVGSSMGGWLSLLIAAKFRRVAGLITIAAALDFTRDIAASLSLAQKKDLAKKGFFHQLSAYGQDLIITRNFLDDGEIHCLLDQKFTLECPVCLLHGKEDIVVPWQKSQQLLKILENGGNARVRTIYVADSDHSLSRAQDLALLNSEIERMNLTIL